MAKQHEKHTALRRPAYGTFHRNEWAFIGAPCGVIQDVTARLIQALAPHFRLGYADADHAAGDSADAITPKESHTVFTDKIDFHRLDTQVNHEFFQVRPWFHSVEGVLINGNHFNGKRQIVILDPRKQESLSRKLDKLTDVALILTTDNQVQPYDFLKTHLEGRFPIMMPLGDINGIIQWMRAQFTAARPPLYGLVLAGGKSQRMGIDKGSIAYRGQLPQREYVAQLMRTACKEVFYSIRPGQENAPDGLCIEDTFAGLGPYGAILSAFREYPDVAWLVIACDLPFLDENTLQQLTANRSFSSVATAFHNADTGCTEPFDYHLGTSSLPADVGIFSAGI
ncbi:MAG: NTP transferase domain-containing protein [Saprospiraceae bacterium]